MNAFVRQIAVLSVLWSLCELLLPSGRQQKMARMPVSILVMAALISAVSGLLGTRVQVAGLPALAQAVEDAGAQSYTRIAIQAAANQTERFAVSLARQAGYSARVAVAFRADGALDHIQLWLERKPDTPPLVEEGRLAEALAQRLGVQPSLVWLNGNGADAP